jgi:hypothetical protein
MGDQPQVSLTWYQGVEKPEIWTKGLIPPYQSGVLFVGDKGMIVSDYGKHVVLLDDTVKASSARPLHPEVARATTRSGSTPARRGRRRRATSSTRVC